MPASTARAFEDPDVASLSGGVVSVDYGQILPKLENLAFRKGIHASEMEYGKKRDWWDSAALVRHVIPGKRSNFLLLSETVGGFTYFRELAKVIFGKLAFHSETPQRITLPSRAVLRPFKYFL